MNCTDIQELLSAYIDKECTDEEQKIIELHLQTCSRCKEEYNLLNNIVNKINNIEELDIPEGFHNDLMSKIHEMSPSPYPTRLNRFYQNHRRVAAIFIFVIMITAISTVTSLKIKEPIIYDTKNDMNYSQNLTGDLDALEEKEEISMFASEVEEKSVEKEIQDNNEKANIEEDTVLENNALRASPEEYGILEDNQEDSNIAIATQIELENQQEKINLHKIMKVISILGIGTFIALSIGYIVTYFYKKK